MRALLAMLAALLASTSLARAQAPESYEQAVEQYNSLQKQQGEIYLAERRVRLSVPYTHFFIPQPDADRFLYDLLQNPRTPDVQGVLIAYDAQPMEPNGWFAVVKYSEAGHVFDENPELDPDATMDLLRRAEAQRSMTGGMMLSLTGWIEQPRYDAARHMLVWAIDVHASTYTGEAAAQDAVNYTMIKLGRTGMLTINVVGAQGAYESVRSSADVLLSIADFAPGYQYSDFQPGDLEAPVTLRGLITGERREVYVEPPPVPQYDFRYTPVEQSAPPPPPAIVIWSILGGALALYALFSFLSLHRNQPVPFGSREGLRDITVVDLDRPVRVRESLRVVRTYFGHYLLALLSLAYVGALGTVTYIARADPTSLWMHAPSWIPGLQNLAANNPTAGSVYYLIVLVAVVNVGFVALLFVLSLLQYIHRRALLAIPVLLSVFIVALGVLSVGVAGEALNRGFSAMWGQGPAATFAAVAVILALMVFAGAFTTGWARNLWRILFARRVNFFAARGWRGAKYRLGTAVRRMLGMPTYISALRRGRRGAMVLFAIAGALAAGAALYPLVAPGLAASTLANATNNLGPSSDNLAAVSIWMTPLLIAAIFLVLLALAWIGGFLGRAAQRRSAARYQSVREWDDRAPILYLRSFAIDNLPVKIPPRGLTARLIGLRSRFATLDETILDCAAPYGPVLAIGDPRDPIPPLGAARTFVDGDDWQSVVEQLVAASQLIVLVVDATAGLQWEVNHVIERGYAAHTLFLASPSRNEEERRAAMTDILALLGLRNIDMPERIVALAPSPAGGVVLFTAPLASSDTFAVALNLRLQEDFGLSAEFPRRAVIA